jgi:hypothetical protein
MKQQQMNVYARFVTEDTPQEVVRSEDGKVRRTVHRAIAGPARSPKQGLKKRAGLPK